VIGTVPEIGGQRNGIRYEMAMRMPYDIFEIR